MAENNIRKLLNALLGPVQGIEDALQQLLSERAVNTAVGDQLDILGAVVGQQRLGMDDDDYRRIVRARISANRSKGTVEDVLVVADLVLGDDDAYYHILYVNNASFVLRVEGVQMTAAVGDLMLRLLKDTVSAGVRIILEWGISPQAELFQFDSGPGFNQGHLAAGHD
jgi:hypothetical protein